MARAFIFSLFVFGLLISCTDFPDLDGSISSRAKRAGFPDLIDLSTIPAAGQGNGDIEGLAQALSVRAAQLRARAARLRGPIVDNRTRQRMADAVGRYNS